MVTYNTSFNLATIEFSTAAQNALGIDDLSTITSHLHEASIDESVGVVLIKSAGETTFCAGANFNQLLALESEKDGKEFFKGFGNVILAIKNCKKIVVGRIHGRAVGGGVGLAAACDYSIASKQATLRLSELNIGLGPLVIGPMVQRKIGLSAFTTLALNPTEWQTAYWAKDKGLYNEVFETQNQCDAYLETVLKSLSEMSGPAKLSVKKMLWTDTDHWERLMEDRAHESAALLMTPECKAEINKFLNKQA